MCLSSPKAPKPPEQELAKAQTRLTKIESKLEGAGPKKQAKLTAKAEQQRGIISASQAKIDANKPPAPPEPPTPAPVSVYGGDASSRVTQVVSNRSQRAAKRRATAGPSRLRIPTGGLGLSGAQTTGSTGGVKLNIGK